MCYKPSIRNTTKCSSFRPLRSAQMITKLIICIHFCHAKAGFPLPLSQASEIRKPLLTVKAQCSSFTACTRMSQPARVRRVTLYEPGCRQRRRRKRQNHIRDTGLRPEMCSLYGTPRYLLAACKCTGRKVLTIWGSTLPAVPP